MTMTTYRTVAANPRLLIGGVVMLLCGVAVLAWTFGPADADLDSSPASPAEQAGMGAKVLPAPAAAGVRARASAWAECAECGFIVSTREIELAEEKMIADIADGAMQDDLREAQGTPARQHEVTIRLNDGTSRVFVEGHRPNWRPRERVILIAGEGRPAD